ncbi:zinc ABC transporter substrate-binding protein [Sulfurifustis variabilis]|uniref:Zinc ABC transporter substrate-binding protein n=1 Tax=Sulfurifustis variabilis TaxID=1675686 RepID=A0A1B4VCA6_9GAMM|nr:zinc ABC transporter substrate-binding protein [Sulfurifustis variabilis]BAU48991.1 zinc ABC transporter substrate-binding protein [Sulfurifustis variabilis]
MKRLILALLLLAPLAPAHAALNVFACEPEWAALVAELAGERAKVYSATTARQDPHRIEARPSLIARVRRADLVVCTGAELEIGWLPLLLRQAGNARVQPGQAGYFEAAAVVERLDVPTTVDRAMGDVHASGNPHVHTDPRRIARIAEHLSARLAGLDPANAQAYRDRLADFSRRWSEALDRWSARAAPLRGVRVVAHHKDWVYLYEWLGMESAGYLEVKPGIPPSAAHLAALKVELAAQPARLVLRTPYQDPRASEWLAQQTGVVPVELPYTAGGTPGTADLFGLVEVTVERLLAGLQ